MPKPGRPKKAPFELLPPEFKDAIEQSSVDEIKARIYQTAVESSALKKARKEDQDLADKKELVKEAGAVYSEGLKMNELKIEFAKIILEGKGVKTA